MSPRYRMGTGPEETRRAAYEAVDSTLEALACIAAVLRREAGLRSSPALAEAIHLAVRRARADLGRLRPPSRSGP